MNEKWMKRYIFRLFLYFAIIPPRIKESDPLLGWDAHSLRDEHTH